MLDPAKIKEFWEARGAKYEQVPFESISNLEEDPQLLQMKIDVEKSQVLPRLNLQSDCSILDLGAGVGQWTFRFAPLVRRVVAVEYSVAQAELAVRELANRCIGNVAYVVSAAEDFETDEKFDIVFISGLFVYMIDEQVEKLLPKISTWLTPHGRVFLRDGTSIMPQRHCIVDRYSDILKANYSAIYRTRQEYIDLFARAGFQLTEDGQMFPEGFPLNKYPETRLRFYSFIPQKD